MENTSSVLSFLRRMVFCEANGCLKIIFICANYLIADRNISPLFPKA